MTRLKTGFIHFYLKYLKGLKTADGLFRFALERKGGKALFIHGEREWDLDKLAGKAKLMVHSFASDRIESGDVVAVHLANSLEFLEIRIACFLGGQIFCALIDDFSPADMIVKLKETNARILYHDDRLDGEALALIRRSCPGLIIRHGKSERPHVGATISVVRKKIRPDDLSAVGFTSGTTGLSKSVLWPQRVWAESFYHLLRNGRPTRGAAIFLLAMPFSTVGCLNILPVIMMGARAYILEKFDEEEVARMIRERGITHMVLAPSFLYRLYAYFRENNLSVPDTLQSLTVGSAVLSPAQWRRINLFFKGTVNQSYGMAEVLAPLAGRSLPDESEDARSVGRPIPQVSIRLREKDEEGRGLISIRSTTRSRAYLGQETEAFGPGKWFHSDDWGFFNDRGELTILGRSRDRWIRGDKVIFRRDLEELFHRIDDVSDAAVFLEGNILSAEVVLHRNSLLREKELLDALAPGIPTPLQIGDIRFVDSLSLSSSGKKTNRISSPLALSLS
jgi:acyl-CoA synthetase (AMP-forming)/AMP-acid ligase II